MRALQHYYDCTMGKRLRIWRCGINVKRKSRIGFFDNSFFVYDAAVLPMLMGGKFNVTFFAMSMVFLAIGLGIAKKRIGS